MPDFEAGDVVRAPFPYTDRHTTQRRPALVVSNGAIGPAGNLLWVVMITSAENRTWPGDVPLIEDHLLAGLPVPSLVRPTKIATIDAGRVDRLGNIARDKLAAVDAVLRSQLTR